MAIKCHDHGLPLVLPSVRHRLPDYLLVSQVNPVEYPDRQAHFSRLLQLPRRMNDAHQPPASFRKGITQPSSCGGVSLSTSSSGFACSTSNFPDVTLRSVARWAPHPSFCPSSCAMLRT